MSTSALDDLLARLDNVRRSGTGWSARCPTHDDRTNSLSINQADGKVLLRCHAGCATADILSALGLGWSALFETPANGHGSAGVPASLAGRPVPTEPITWWSQYCSVPLDFVRALPLEPAGGRLAFTFAGQSVRKLRAAGGKDFAWLPAGAPTPPLWPLPPGALPATIWLCEGESDCTVLRFIGLDAFALTRGAGGTLKVTEAEALAARGVREAVIVFDADAPGREGAAKLAAVLAAAGIAARVLDLAGAGLVDPLAGQKDARDAWLASDKNAARFALRFEAAAERAEPATPAAEDAGTGQASASDAVTVRLADVAPASVRWLWPGRIPLGKLTILDGDPGLGKSLLALDLAARVSTDLPMPDRTTGDLGGPRGVVLLAGEDDPADTIRPRLDAAGADCARIVLLKAVHEREVSDDGKVRERVRPPTLADLDQIRAAVEQVNAALVIVDPLTAFTVGDTHVDAEVRPVLARLAELAAELGVAIVAVRHLNKSGGSNPLYRGGGSIAFIASARAGLLVARDPDDATGKRRVLAVTKSNLAEEAPSLAYTILPAENGAVRVAWLGESTHTARTILQTDDDRDEATALEEACDFLCQVLASGPRPTKEVEAEARGAGISAITLRRAREKLQKAGQLEVKKPDFNSPWLWQLVAGERGAQVDHPVEDDQLRDHDQLGPAARSLSALHRTPEGQARQGETGIAGERGAQVDHPVQDDQLRDHDQLGPAARPLEPAEEESAGEDWEEIV